MEFLQQNWFWAAMAGISGGFLLLDFVLAKGDKAQLTPVEATMLINREDALVIDVRDQADYARGHVPNARHIPLAELGKRTAELDKFRSQPLILCCATGTRSHSAIAALRKAGFEKLFHLRGGIQEWEKAGQPLTSRKKGK